MIITKKLKSFTLAEMLVVLVLSAIVVSLAIVVLALIQKQVLSIESIEKNKQEIILFERTLWQDFNQGQVQYELKKSKLFIYAHIDTIEYKFNEDFVLRNRDTLHVEIKKIKCYLDGNEIKEGQADAVEILFPEYFHKMELFVFKDKDASFYMNY